MTSQQSTVFVVDDDEEMRASVELLLESVGLSVETFASAEQFLQRNLNSIDAPKCLVLDLRMPGLSGLGLQEVLAAEGVDIPIIFLTGYGDVPTAVTAMQSGAVDFLQKPLHRQALLERVERALTVDGQRRLRRALRGDVESRLESLSSREREVCNLILQGKTTKQIAGILGVGLPTIAKHRAKVFRKLGTKSVVELVKLLAPRRPANTIRPGPDGSSLSNPHS